MNKFTVRCDVIDLDMMTYQCNMGSIPTKIRVHNDALEWKDGSGWVALDETFQEAYQDYLVNLEIEEMLRGE